MSSEPTTARPLAAQLDQARRSLPYGSVHIAAAGAAVVALLLGITSWGYRPSWVLGVLTLAGIGLTLAADLRRRGAFAAPGWPLRAEQERMVAAVTLVLLAAATVETLHVVLGSLFWLTALAAFGWGAWEWLAPYADVRPRRLLGGYRGLALGGAVVLLAAMTQLFGQTAGSFVTYAFDYVGNYYAGIPYSGMSVEWAEPVVVAVVAGMAALLASGAWRPAWWRLVPAGAALLSLVWLLASLATSELMKSGGKQLAYWVAVAGAAAFAVGAVLIASGREDGAWSPARLIARARAGSSTPAA